MALRLRPNDSARPRIDNPLPRRPLSLRSGVMRSHPEASPKANCRATTKAGAPCRKQAVADGLCTFHSGAIDLAEAGRKGGRARGKKQEPADRLEALATTALEELLSSGSATARVQAAKFALDRLTANSPAGLEVAKRALWLDQQAERALELPATREKLARLVERDAQARAEAITAERIAELVERKAEERAEQMYAERMRLETEAVRAELRVDASDVARPGGQPSPAELAEQERARVEHERIERELRGDP